MKDMQVEQLIVFTEEDIRPFLHIVKGQRQDRSTVPSPAILLAYQKVEKPWELIHPVILHKQEWTQTKHVYIDEPYTFSLAIQQRRALHGRTFFLETMDVYDRLGQLCFSGESTLSAGGKQ
ncbi:hypothetical protein [Bacillus sp. 1P06AnD]|uniref:hypothetical protein n=1 Tax=Bacillus sp. 1P06AnD TaxID=3132208 RepID=UPI0039A2ACF4